MKQPAKRHRYAQSWWFASEIQRRHPEFLIVEMHPGGGMYDVLAIMDQEVYKPDFNGDSNKLMINREGTIQGHKTVILPDGESSFETEMLVKDWHDIYDTDDSYRFLRIFEQRMRWMAPSETPHTSPRTLAYRFIAAALHLQLHAKELWDARNSFKDSSEMMIGEPEPRFIKEFPAAVEDRNIVQKQGFWGEPDSHFWALTRDGEAHLLISIEGKVYFRNGNAIDLMKIYDKNNRKLMPTVLAVMRPWLK